MTICGLRKQYPYHEFYFFKDGREMRKAPFFHDKIKDYEVKRNYIFIEM